MSQNEVATGKPGVVAGVLISIVALAAVGTGQLGGHDVQAPQPRSFAQPEFTPSDSEPCAGATLLGLSDPGLLSDALTAGFSIAMPQDDVAGGSSVDRAWWCPRSSSLRVEFTSGVVLYLESGAQLGNVSEHWARQAGDGDGELVSIKGGQALVRASAGTGESQVATLQMVMADGTWISLRGTQSVGVAGLERIASTFPGDVQ